MTFFALWVECMNNHAQGKAWSYGQLSCTRRMKISLDKQELPTAWVLLLLDPLHILQRQDNSRHCHWACSVAKSRKGYICEVTAASEQRSQGWRQGQAVITALISHFSLAVEKWQSQIFPFSLPYGFAYAAAEQTCICFVLLVPLRILSAVLGWTLRKHIHFNECLLFHCE